MRHTILLATLVVQSSFAALAGKTDGKAEVRYVVAGKTATSYRIAGDKGRAKLLVNASTGAADVAVSILTLAPGASVPEHVHADGSETLYIERGRVEMTIGAETHVAGPGDAVYLPAGVRHSARVVDRLEALRAVQVYVGPGPEQRFATGPVDTDE